MSAHSWGTHIKVRVGLNYTDGITALTHSCSPCRCMLITCEVNKVIKLFDKGVDQKEYFIGLSK